jgi:hypothetical protein
MAKKITKEEPKIAKTVPFGQVFRDTAGQPPKFESAQELQTAIDTYFREGVEKKLIVTGPRDNRQLSEIEVPTITGLCYFLGFESRQSFYDYEKRVGFSYTIKKARLFIEKHYEELLQTGNTIGAIFALKNFDWKDKQEVEQSGTVTIKYEDPGNYVYPTQNQGNPGIPESI